MNKNEIITLISGEQYYSVKDLRYNKKIGIMMSREEFANFISAKESLAEDHPDIIKKLPLKAFNSKMCYYVNGLYLLAAHNDYFQILLSDYELNQSWLFDRNVEDILISRLFSEVEGSLKIENIPTTHKRISEISRGKISSDQNDIIVQNMLNAVDYIIKEKPAFTKDNLRKLYTMLSNNSLPDELKLNDGEYYRNDKVYIGDFEGAPSSMIEECMDTLFAFANDPSALKAYDCLLPYICHYYILYIHPYFDFNGRTARMVSFWLSYINDITTAPYFMSEAINESKGDYYTALIDTRVSGNDLTYFLGYILETSIKYSMVYKNLENIRDELLKSGDTLTSTEWVYVKKILVHNAESYFNYKLFLTYIGASMSKQGAVKILNNLADYGILEKATNKRGETIYKLNESMITYKYNA